jgi:hypothetical protein
MNRIHVELLQNEILSAATAPRAIATGMFA